MTNPLATSLLASPSMYNRMATPGLSPGMGSANMPASPYITGSTAPFDPMALSSPSISSLLGTGAGTSASTVPAMASSVTASGMTQQQLSVLLQEISTLFKAVMQMVIQGQGQKAQATPPSATTPSATTAVTPAATSSQTPVAAPPPTAVTPKTLPAVSNAGLSKAEQAQNAHDLVYLLKDDLNSTESSVTAKSYKTSDGGSMTVNRQGGETTLTDVQANGAKTVYRIEKDKAPKTADNPEGIGLFIVDAQGNQKAVENPRAFFQNLLEDRFAGLNCAGDKTIPDLVEYLFGHVAASGGAGSASGSSSAPASGSASTATAVNETPSANTSTTTGGTSVGGGDTTTPPEATDSSCPPSDSSTVVPVNPPSTGCDKKQDPPAKPEETKKDNVVGQVASVAGAIGGGVVGAGIGAGVGAVLALPFPPAAVVTVPAGAIAGALVGGDAGGKVMKAVGNTVGEVVKTAANTGGKVVGHVIDGDFNKVGADLKDGKDKVVKAVKDGWKEVQAVPGKVFDDVKKAVDAINPFKK